MLVHHPKMQRQPFSPVIAAELYFSLNCVRILEAVIMFVGQDTRVTENTENTHIEEIKKENDKIVMKIFGLDYEKYFAQKRQDED